MRHKVYLSGKLGSWDSIPDGRNRHFDYEIEPFNDTSDVAASIVAISIDSFSHDQRTLKALDDVRDKTLLITIEWLD